MSPPQSITILVSLTSYPKVISNLFLVFAPLPASIIEMENQLLTGPAFPEHRDSYMPQFYSIRNKGKTSGDVLQRLCFFLVKELDVAIPGSSFFFLP